MSIPDRLGENADSIYAALIEAHAGLSEEQSADLDAHLVLLMMNEIADEERLSAIFSAARKAFR